MREIKFRGKRKDNGEWVYGYLVDKNAISCGLGYVDEEKNDYILIDCYLVIPKSIGQYTGLKDRNGKEIYEGDIVIRNEMTGVVEFRKGCYCLVPDYRGLRWINENDELEVIGNIYDNPELLEKGGD